MAISQNALKCQLAAKQILYHVEGRNFKDVSREVVEGKNPILSNTLIEKMLPIKEISQLALFEGNGKKPIYEIHKWWARRLSVVVRSAIVGALLPANASEKKFWRSFYNSHKADITVLDCFMGGGTSLVEAKKIGAKTIGVDIDPLACFITKKELEKCDYKKIQAIFDDMLEVVGKEIRNFYLTEVEGKQHPIINAFWVYEVECDRCNQRFETHPHYKLFYDKNEQIVFCRNCGQVHSIKSDATSFKCFDCNVITEVDSNTYKNGYCTCPECNNKFKLPGKVNGSNSLKLFAIEYEKNFQRFFKKADQNDINLYECVQTLMQQNIKKYFIPDTEIPTENRENVRPMSHGYHFYKDLFNSRQLFSLALILNEIIKISDSSLREWFILAFSDCLASNNMLCNYAYGYKKLTPLFGIHAYTVPVRPVENNVWGSGTYGRGTFEKTVKKMLKAKRYCDNTYECKINHKNNIEKVFTGEVIHSKVTSLENEFYNGLYDSLILNTSSERLRQIKDKSVDVILTDPPYYDNLHYSELADFYYQWIKGLIHSNHTDPIREALYVNSYEEDSKGVYEKRLQRVFSECFAKLKDEGIMIFSYHHNKEEAWGSLGRVIKEAGFIITNVFPVRSEGKSGYHTTENSIKWDSILVLRKKGFLQLRTDSRIIYSMKMKIAYWAKYNKSKNLDMKGCDLLSFYRSLAVMLYTQYEKKYCLNGLMKKAEMHMKYIDAKVSK